MALSHVTSTGLVLSGALGTGRRLGTRRGRGLLPPITTAGMGIGLKKYFSATSHAISGLLGIGHGGVTGCWVLWGR